MAPPGGPHLPQVRPTILLKKFPAISMSCAILPRHERPGSYEGEVLTRVTTLLQINKAREALLSQTI